MQLDRFGAGGWTPARLPDLGGKTYLVTGANSGIGLETTRVLASKGARVLMLCRDQARADAAAAEIKRSSNQADLTIVLIDLTELASVRDAASQVLQVAPTIDGLILNAGIMMPPKRIETGDGFERQMAVNHFSQFLLAGMLFRLLANDGRIVATSSIAHRSGLKRIKFEDISFKESYTPWAAYAQSKLANVLFGLELDRRLQAAGSKIKAVICHPGIASTNLAASMGPVLRTMNKIVSPLVTQSAEKGAWPTLLAAADPEAKGGSFYGPTRRGQTGGPVREVEPASHALDKQAATTLWEVSEQSTAISWPAL